MINIEKSKKIVPVNRNYADILHLGKNTHCWGQLLKEN